MNQKLLKRVVSLGTRKGGQAIRIVLYIGQVRRGHMSTVELAKR